MSKCVNLIIKMKAHAKTTLMPVDSTNNVRRNMSNYNEIHVNVGFECDDIFENDNFV